MDATSYRHHHALIIDDNKMDILLLKEILTGINFAKKITSFESPTTAFNFLMKCEKLPDLIFPDIIFVDLIMPGMSGFKFIETCTKEFTHSLNFIIVSSSSNPSDIKKSSTYSNVRNYFVKPVKKLDLSNL